MFVVLRPRVAYTRLGTYEVLENVSPPLNDRRRRAFS